MSRSALWLCRRCSYQRPTTYSGMYTLTASRGFSLRRPFTYSTTGRVISRYGESRIFSGTLIPRRSHSSRRALVSAGSTLMLSASRASERVSLAKARARRVGLWTLETRTMEWTRDGRMLSSEGPSAAAISAETRS